MAVTKSELMECSNETLALWTTMCREEMKRRHIDAEAMPVHAGLIENGRPMPLAVRVIQKIAALPPAALSKVEVYADMLRAAPDIAR